MPLTAAFGEFADLPAAWHFAGWTIAARLIAIVIARALAPNLVVVA